MKTPFFGEGTTVSVDFFEFHWLNGGVDTTVVVVFCAISLAKCEIVFDLSVDFFEFN